MVFSKNVKLIPLQIFQQKEVGLFLEDENKMQICFRCYLLICKQRHQFLDTPSVYSGIPSSFIKPICIVQFDRIADEYL